MSHSHSYHQNRNNYDPLHSTITTINYQSLIKLAKEGENDQIPSYMDSKCKYKIRRTKQSLPYLNKIASRIPSLPNFLNKSPNNGNCTKIIIDKSQINNSTALVHLLQKNQQKHQLIQEQYFQRSRNSSFVDNLLAQLKSRRIKQQ